MVGVGFILLGLIVYYVLGLNRRQGQPPTLHGK
jgi:hypothetical protein